VEGWSPSGCLRRHPSPTCLWLNTYVTLYLEVTFMPSAHPRINTVLEPPVYRTVKRLAVKDGVSLSQKVRDLVREALDLLEDAALEEVVNQRRKNPAASIPHAEVKRRFRIK